MRIAIIGAGIAGNVAARQLHRRHDITVFETNDYAGGHTHTLEVEQDGRSYNLDTGFIVFNDWTYPRFQALLAELGIAAAPSDMGFSVCTKPSGLEYSGASLNGLFAQRRNLLRPDFYRMLRDILRFNRTAPVLLDAPDDGRTLGSYLRDHGYSSIFIDNYIIPMGAAIWSMDPVGIHDFPARHFVRFFHNHGLLSVHRRPNWYVVRGGAKRYVEALIRPFRERVRLSTPVAAVKRYPHHVTVAPRGSAPECFDCVFMACHSDQALALLADASPAERAVLGALTYQENEAVVHTDASLLPRRRRAWAAWNFHVLSTTQRRPAVTYNLSILQGIEAPRPFCVTLNHSEAIDPARIIRRMHYEHPVVTPASVAAQRRQHEINGTRRTFFCGAYWRYGFHEDGIVSAVNALNDFEQTHEELHLPRAG